MVKNKIDIFKKIIPLITYFSFSGLIIYTSLHHEKWVDEAQPWLIARDLDFFSMIKQLRYEVTPGLWHFIQYPLAHLGFPYITQTILNLIFCHIAAYFLLFRSPFSLPIKILFIFSYYFSFEYAVIARSYGLTILLLFILLSFFHLRFRHVFLFSLGQVLLAQTNVVGLFLALSFWLTSWFDFFYLLNTKKSVFKFIIYDLFILVGLLLSLFQFWPTIDPARQSTQLFSSIEIPSIINSFVAGFLPFSLLKLKNFDNFRELIYIFDWPNLLLALIFIATIFWRFFSSRRIILFTIFSFLPLFFLLGANRVGHLRHYGFFLIITFAAYWLDKKISPVNKKTIKEKAFLFFIALSLLFLDLVGFRAHYLDQKYFFSDAINIADFINHNNLSNYPIYVSDSVFSVSILPYLNQTTQFFYLRPQRSGSFFILDRQFYLSKNTNIDKIIEEFIPPQTNKKSILITTESISLTNQKKWHLIYQTQGYIMGYDNKRFYLYESK